MFLTRRFVILILIFFCCSLQSLATDESKELMERNRRFIPFQQNTGCGFIVAMAIPLQNIGRHVFLAFNFEAHYGIADKDTYSLNSINKVLTGKRSVNEKPSITSESSKTEKGKKKKKSNKLFTRTRLYAAIDKNLSKMGYNGTSCLLKIICEAAEVPVNPNNGVLGSVFHIVFTPSSSEDEGLPDKFYNAEISGTEGDCTKYNSDCPNDMMKLITKTMFLK